MNAYRAALLMTCLVLLASSCSTTIPELDPLNHTSSHLDTGMFTRHVLMFNTRGAMLDPLSGHPQAHRVSTFTRYSKLQTDSPAFTAYIDNIIAGIREQKAIYGHVRILFFFHGGLNTRASALARAAHDIATARSDDESLYPIFVNWQTSAYGSYIDHLLWIKKGQDTGSKGPLLAPFQLGNDLVSSAADIPVANAVQFSDWWRALTPHPHESVVVANNCFESLDFRQGQTPEHSVASRLRSAATGVPTLILTKWWIAGVLSAAGSRAWSSMLYTSDRLFYSDAEMHHDHSENFAYEHPSLNGTGGLARFLDRLVSERVLDDRDDITLVAHSAGAVVANNIVGNFGEVLPIHTLVYMAPACTIDEVMPGGRIARFLGGDLHRQLYILALHEQAELNEKGYIDFTPRGSLLVWLDEFIQPKHSELRGVMLGRVRNLRTHAHLISCDLYRQIHITAFNDNPETHPAIEPQRHGEFGDLRYWSKTTWRPTLPGIEPLLTTTDPHAVNPHLP